MAKKKDRVAELLAKYLGDNNVLVADSSGPSRAGIAKTLISLGANSSKVDRVGEYSSAKETIEQRSPKIVVTDYHLGNQCGLDLCELVRKYRKPVNDDVLFVMVTGDASQSVVARASEEDVDAYVLKPYTLDYFEKTLKAAVQTKLEPTDYLKHIQEGKILAKDSKHSDAIQKFEAASKLNPKPALACYYRGASLLELNQTDEAKKSFEEGLVHNEIHYKCLNGLYDLLMKIGEKADAYETLKTLNRYFPANSVRLTQVLKLAVGTGNYTDIETFYESFKAIEVRNEEITKCTCAALVVASRFFFRKGEDDRGLDVLKKASVSAGGRAPILREVITTLAEKKYSEEALEALKRFPASAQTTPDYRYAQLLVDDITTPDPRLTAQNARMAIKEGMESALIYRLMIKRFVDAERQDEAEDAFYEACKKFPDNKPVFESALGDQKANKESA